MYKKIFDKKELLDILCKETEDDKSNIYCIGYYINDKCTLYFDKRNFAKDKVSKEELLKALQSNEISYKNIPLDLWFEHHNSFCNNLAQQLSKKYNYNHDEILSDIYYQICLLYRQNKYLGSLNYITKSCENFIRLKYRKDKFDKLVKNATIISLDSLINNEDDVTIADIIPDIEIRSNYEKLQDILKSSLFAFGFTMNEINCILQNNSNMLTYNRYRKFLHWKNQHNIKEFLDELQKNM